MQVCETFLSKKWHTVMWHRECEQSIHVQQPRGLDLREKVLALALPRRRPRLFSQGQGQGRPPSKTWGAKAKASWGVLEDPRGQARPRGQQDWLYQALFVNNESRNIGLKLLRLSFHFFIHSFIHSLHLSAAKYFSTSLTLTVKRLCQ